MRTSATLTTYKCNACGKEHTFAGNTPSIDARLAGWETETQILGGEVDLCPECVTDLREFLNYDVPESIDAGSGGDWAGVPTPTKDEVMGVGMDLTEGGTR